MRAAVMTDDPFRGTPYRAVGWIGRGGMGDVFKVEHAGLGSHFAAKLLHEWLAEHPQVVDRVRLEAQALGRLAHPNIVSITGFATTPDGRPYIVMELLRGRAVSTECEARGAMPVFGALFYTRQLLSGLGAAHELGIVHRDIKPNNLFLHEYDHGVRTLKILDFGVARVVEHAQRRAPQPLAYPTERGVLLGTPRYMSPEAISGDLVDHRADLYSVGLVLYQLLAGRDPYHHITSEEMLLSAHVLEEALPPSETAQQAIPTGLDSIVLKALAKDPADRFQSAAEFEVALSRIAATVEPPAEWVQTTGFDIDAVPLAEWVHTAHSAIDKVAPPVPPRGPEAAPQVAATTTITLEPAASAAPTLAHASIDSTLTEPVTSSATSAQIHPLDLDATLDVLGPTSPAAELPAAGLGVNEAAPAAAQQPSRSAPDRWRNWFAVLVFLATSLLVAILASRGLAAVRAIVEGP